MKHHDTVDHVYRATSFADLLGWFYVLIHSTYVVIWHVVIRGKRPHQDLVAILAARGQEVGTETA